jgi:hypothetical protein
MPREARSQPDFASDSARSAPGGAVVPGGAKSYVPAPDFAGTVPPRAGAKSRRTIAFGVAGSLLLTAALLGVFRFGAERAPASLPAASAQFSLVPLGASELAALPDPERQRAREGGSQRYFLTVVAPGAPGALVRVKINGTEAGQLDLGSLGARVPISVELGKEILVTETLAQAGKGASEFSVFTTEGDQITRPMKVGETISWTVRAK